MSIKHQYKSLTESLKLVALPYEEQIESLPDFVVVVDEIISTFCDAFLLLPQIIENDLLTKQAIASIIRCFNWVDLISRKNELLNLEALKSHEFWIKARTFAQKALKDMDETITKPDLSHIDWID